MEYLSHTPNTFCWAELATVSVEEAKEFYRKLFSISAYTNTGGSYHLLEVDGKPVGGMYELAQPQEITGIPPHWMPYIICDDLIATLEKVKANSGTVVVDPWAAGDIGATAIIQDVEGALLGLWQGGSLRSSAWKHRHGTISWFEHASKGNKETVPFYEKVFGYSSRTEPMGDSVYTTFYLGDEVVAGLYIMPEMMRDVPPHWLIYFAVNSVDKALEVTVAAKGEILMPKTQVPGIGMFAVIRDPQGAVLGLIEGEKVAAE